jgi:hypothetical protein
VWLCTLTSLNPLGRKFLDPPLWEKGVLKTTRRTDLKQTKTKERDFYYKNTKKCTQLIEFSLLQSVYVGIKYSFNLLRKNSNLLIFLDLLLSVPDTIYGSDGSITWRLHTSLDLLSETSDKTLVNRLVQRLVLLKVL